jgi:hypothetical protein
VVVVVVMVVTTAALLVARALLQRRRLQWRRLLLLLWLLLLLLLLLLLVLLAVGGIHLTCVSTLIREGRSTRQQPKAPSTCFTRGMANSSQRKPSCTLHDTVTHEAT